MSMYSPKTAGHEARPEEQRRTDDGTSVMATTAQVANRRGGWAQPLRRCRD
jgi:hypothetical protein